MEHMARRKRKTSQRSAKGGGLSLNTTSLLSFTLFSLILVAAVYTSQQELVAKVREHRSIDAQRISEQAAAQIDVHLAGYLTGLETFARDPQTRLLFASNDQRGMQRRAQDLRGMLDGSLNVRIIQAGTERVNQDTVPHFSFACLDQLRSSTKLAQSHAEIHALNTDQQHLDIIVPVTQGGAGDAVGYVQATLDVNLLKSWVKLDSENAYVEVAQHFGKGDALPLLQVGNAHNKGNVSSNKVTLSHAPWEVIAWREASLAESGLSVLTIIVAGLAIFICGLVILWLRQSLSHAITGDIDNILRLTIDHLRGDKSRAYAFQIKEFKLAARQIEEMQVKKLDRERDDDPRAINLNTSGSFDFPSLGGMSSDSILVEEMSGESSMVQAPTKTPAAGAPATQRAVFEAKPAGASLLESSGSITAPQAPGETPLPEIFKAYDIRGIVGRTLTGAHARLIGRAIGSEAVARGLSVMAFGRDGRLSGPELGQGLVTGLREAGINVIDVGMVPTPVLYYAANELANGSGVMLTGSHNPPDYNGFKMVLGGDTLSGDAIQELRKRIESKDFTSGQGTYQTSLIANQYIERIIKDVRPKRRLKVVIDCGNGVAGAIAPKLFRGLGCEVKELFCDVDGKFPNHHPDPSKPENLKDLIEAVKVNKADVGLAFDGDGDRLGVIAPLGNIVWPDRLMMLFASDVLMRNPGAQIIYDIKCSNNLTKVIWEKGGEPVMWKTGHSFIKAKMRDSGALLAGEMSGHIFFKERWYGFDDGLYSGARLLEILAGDARPPQDVFNGLPDAVNTPELNIKMAEGAQHKFMEDFMDKAEFGDANVVMIDGIRADFSDSWGLVRASNTTPVLVLRFEGKDVAALRRVQEVFRKLLLALKPDLKLPF